MALLTRHGSGSRPAADWLLALLAVAPGTPAWGRGLRLAAAMIVPLAVGVIVGQPTAGLLVGLGAFVVASEVGRPVVPLAILGTREILSPGARLPRHGDVQVRVGDALVATGPGWASARDVAGQAKSAIEVLLSERDA